MYVVDIVLGVSLLQAIKENKVDTVTSWIDGKKPIDRYVDCRDGHFVYGDAKVNKKNMTALHYAAFFCKVDIVQILLDADAGIIFFKDGTNGSVPHCVRFTST